MLVFEALSISIPVLILILFLNKNVHEMIWKIFAVWFYFTSACVSCAPLKYTEDYGEVTKLVNDEDSQLVKWPLVQGHAILRIGEIDRSLDSEVEDPKFDTEVSNEEKYTDVNTRVNEGNLTDEDFNDSFPDVEKVESTETINAPINEVISNILIDEDFNDSYPDVESLERTDILYPQINEVISNILIDEGFNEAQPDVEYLQFFETINPQIDKVISDKPNAGFNDASNEENIEFIDTTYPRTNEVHSYIVTDADSNVDSLGCTDIIYSRVNGAHLNKRIGIGFNNSNNNLDHLITIEEFHKVDNDIDDDHSNFSVVDRYHPDYFYY